ncbi:MAG: acyl-CoA dehydrogenase family protein, partial [Fervidobacterium sp.]
MDYLLGKEHLLALELFKEFAQKEVKPLAQKVDEEEYFPYETVKKMGKIGMMGIPFPKEIGGAGGDYLSYVLAVEELAKVCATTAIVLSAHTSLCCWPI